MLEMIGYAAAALIGVSLGLIGGGGSVLTVPVLVYLMGVSPVLATAYSLFIVGSSAAVGAFRYARKGQIDFRTALIFGIPSIIAVYIPRKFVVPAIPEEVFEFGNVLITKGTLLMVLFALLMLVASIGMIRKRKESSGPQKSKSEFQKVLIVLAEGLIVGGLTGLVGAGGGFLIIPALVLFAGLKMKTAIGTSLIIISAKSLIGFLGDVSNYDVDWSLLIIFSVLAIGGIFIGSFLSTKVDGPKLKKGFGWFVLIMGASILLKEILA